MDDAMKKEEFELMHQIYVTLISLAKKLEKHDRQDIAGMTASQYMVILAILLSPQAEMTMVNIAKKLDTTKQNINQLMPILERKGYVTRSACDNNKRTFVIKVTASGLEAMMEYAGMRNAWMLEIFNGFSKNEMEMLWQLLLKLHRYDGIEYPVFFNEVNQLFENEYPDLLKRILNEYKKGCSDN